MKKIFHVIGAGRVGQTFAMLLGNHPHWQISHIASRSLHENAFGATVLADIATLPPADVVLLAVPDNAIEGAVERLAQRPLNGSLVLHFSGAKTIAALDAVAQHGGMTGSLHPVFAFADVNHAVAHLRGSLCALEADSPKAMALLQQLAADVGLESFALPSEQKARYHAALSAASNFSVTLADYAQNLLSPLALPETLSRRLVVGLMRQTVGNLVQLPPLQALTGPIVRGDETTVAAHLAAMDAEEQAHYLEWARATLDLAAGRLDKAGVERVAAVLDEAEKMDK
ncbi:Rossmann-like and DUF2520 domain-containing protein [Neisseria perflava]|uniref:Rossmann-like and DUF2520 domain-containing protein n=1 Tax=Neisseria perflava TaxID=33053 RepID=UPI00209FA9D3|nr:Rossmann-like and DUF2520 domain-containing protein [Neisseria perflava]MCP1660470.1 putative short-subunit dehydrogenase-like oxidoreductase (DUF2520 family) [Neisseria perflava]